MATSEVADSSVLVVGEDPAPVAPIADAPIAPPRDDAIDLMRRCKQEAASFRAKYEPEIRESARRYAGSSPTVDDAGAAAGVSPDYSTYWGNDLAEQVYRSLTIPRTQTAIIATTAGIVRQPFRPRLKPMESGYEERWYLRPSFGKRLAKLIAAKQKQAQTTIKAAAAEAGAAAAGEDGAPTPIDREMIQQDTQAVITDIQEQHGNLTTEQIAGTAPINEDQFLMLREAVPMIDTDIIAITDRLRTELGQTLLDALWERSGADLHLLYAPTFSCVDGSADLAFEWHASGPRKHSFTISTRHIFNVFTDGTEYDFDRRAYHIETYLISADELAAAYPAKAKEIRDAATSGSQQRGQWVVGGMTGNVNYERPMVWVDVGWFRHQSVKMTAQELAEKDQEMRVDEIPGSPGWTTGIRQIVTLASHDVVIEDLRCPYLDIPHSWIINIVRSDRSAYGLSEPMRLKDIDTTLDFLFGAITDHVESSTFPMTLIPQSLATIFSASSVQPHRIPGVFQPVPDQVYGQIMLGGVERGQFSPAPLPLMLVDLLRLLLEQHQVVSGHSELSQGKSPTPNASGELAKTLADQSSAPLFLRSIAFELGVKRLACLAMDAMAKWLPIPVARKILNAWPEAVIADVLPELREYNWDFTVEVGTGWGGASRQKQEEARANRQAGLATLEDTLAAIGEDDPAGKAQLIRAEQMSSQPATAAQPQGAIA